jgi:hypothetical protein
MMQDLHMDTEEQKNRVTALLRHSIAIMPLVFVLELNLITNGLVPDRLFYALL